MSWSFFVNLITVIVEFITLAVTFVTERSDKNTVEDTVEDDNV